MKYEEGQYKILHDLLWSKGVLLTLEELDEVVECVKKNFIVGGGLENFSTYVTNTSGAISTTNFKEQKPDEADKKN